MKRKHIGQVQQETDQKSTVKKSKFERDINDSIIRTASVHEARSSRSIRRMKGFEDHGESILGEMEADEERGFLKRVAGEEAFDNMESEKITADVDKLGTTLIEPFTLERERQEGEFDLEGNYLDKQMLHSSRKRAEESERYKREKYDINALMKYDKKGNAYMNRDSHRRNLTSDTDSDEDERERDAWLESLEEQEKTMLLKGKPQRRLIYKNQSATASSSKDSNKDKQQNNQIIAQHAATVLKYLEVGEKVSQALVRLSPKGNKQKTKRSVGNIKALSVEKTMEEQAFDEQNYACSQLLSLTGDYNIYDATRNHFEELVHRYNKQQ